MKTNILSIMAVGALLSGALMTTAYADGDIENIYQNLFMETMDSDSDGKITKAEFMKMSTRMAEKKFMMMDMNDDGYLTDIEFKLQSIDH